MDDSSTARVTTREFYTQQLLTQKMISDLEIKLLDEIAHLAPMVNQVLVNKEEIETLRKRSNFVDGFNVFLSAVFALIAGALGIRS
jgi:hypothetical protein